MHCVRWRKASWIAREVGNLSKMIMNIQLAIDRISGHIHEKKGCTALGGGRWPGSRENWGCTVLGGGRQPGSREKQAI